MVFFVDLDRGERFREPSILRPFFMPNGEGAQRSIYVSFGIILILIKDTLGMLNLEGSNTWKTLRGKLTPGLVDGGKCLPTNQ